MAGTKDNRELQEQLEALASEVHSLKERVALLEARQSTAQVTAPAKSSSERTTKKSWERVAGHSQVMKNKLTKEGLESIIGGKLLNRLGILVLLFGLGYFLKYSFDNQWIGELGRVVIGYLGGLGLLVAGDLVMRKQYRIFSQGLTGGGLAALYVTTFAATNFYHLLGSGTAFVLLVLTATAGGLLAVRQNAYGVAVLTTLGGFLSPFLIGSEEANALGLLGYVAVLDLAVLYLAHHKQWRSLNTLSFLGTSLVYTLYSQTTTATEQSIWLNQAFLVLYFSIFGTLAFWHNIRHKKITEARDVWLLVLNAAFFFLSTADNIDRLYADWLGILALLMALLYLLLALTLQKKKLGDTLLMMALLGTGLAFVTIAIPLQLDEERVVSSAWLVEAMALIYGGLRGGNRWVRRAGVALMLMVSLSVHLDIPYFEQPLLPILNFYSVSCILGVLGFFFVAHFYYQQTLITDRERKLVWPAAVLGTVLAIKHIAWEVANGLQYLKLDYSVNFSVSLAWLAFAVFLMLLGLWRNLRGFRYLALALFCSTTAKVMLVDLIGLAMVFRVLILMIVGVILVGVSFIYLRREKGDSK